MQGGSPGPNWYEMVGIPLSSAGLFFQIVPVPSSINPGLDTHSSRAEYHTNGGNDASMNYLRFYIAAGSSGSYSGLFRDQQHSSFSGSPMDSSPK